MEVPPVQIVVSAIVPVYNNPSGIATVLAALIDQEFPREIFEIIVVDNGSTDDTADVVRRVENQHPDLVRLVVEDETRGSYAARNRGVRAARGRVMAFIDSDCVPDRTWVANGLRALEQVPASLGGGRIEFTFNGDSPNVFEYYDSARKLGQEAYVKKGFAATANLFVWKGLFDGHGLFKGELVSGGDYEFGLRVTGGGEKLVYIPDAIVRHPARRTFGAVFAKSRRIAKGQRQLRRLGLLDRPSMRQLLPAKSWPVHPGRTEPLSAVNKLQLIALQSIFRWLNFLVRQV